MALCPVVKRVRIGCAQSTKPVRVACMQSFNLRPSGADLGAVLLCFHDLGESLHATEGELPNEATNQRIVSSDAASNSALAGALTHAEPEFVNIVAHRILPSLLGFGTRGAHNSQHSLGQYEELLSKVPVRKPETHRSVRANRPAGDQEGSQESATVHPTE